MATIEYAHINKIYPGKVHAVKDLDLTIDDGEFMVIVGPSGCGKTTAMRLCAGLEEITSGTLLIDGKTVNHLQPQQRNVAMVFQNYALYPHMSVRANLAFPLRMRRMRRKEIAEQVGKVADMLELGELLDRKPKQLSGGQRQRVAMGRALVRNPVAFLMDEPLSNLDAKLRVSMRSEISSLQRQTDTTTIYVTHDQVEAMTMGDRVAVMRLGVLQQVAPPQELYDHPANVFVASFIGSPSMNLLQCPIEAHGDDLHLRFGGELVAIDAAAVARLPRLRACAGSTVTVGLRPEAFVPADQQPPERHITLTPTALEPLGHEQMLYSDVDIPRIHISDLESETDSDDQNLQLVARLPARFPATVGQAVTLGVDTSQLHAFDADGHRLTESDNDPPPTA